MSFLSDPSAIKVKNQYINGFLDCSGNVLFRRGNVIIGNLDYPNFDVNQQSLLVNGKTVLKNGLDLTGTLLVNGAPISGGGADSNGNIYVTGNLFVNQKTTLNGNISVNGNISTNSQNIALGYQAGNTS